MCVCVYIYVYLIDYEYFNNLKGDKDIGGEYFGEYGDGDRDGADMYILIPS